MPMNVDHLPFFELVVFLWPEGHRGFAHPNSPMIPSAFQDLDHQARLHTN